MPGTLGLSGFPFLILAQSIRECDCVRFSFTVVRWTLLLRALVCHTPFLHQRDAV